MPITHKCIFYRDGDKCKFTKAEVDCFFPPELEQDCDDMIPRPQGAEELYKKAQSISILNDSVR